MRLANLSCAAAAALILAAAGGTTAVAQDGAAGAAACADIADAQARLECYDAAVGRAVDPAAPPQVVAPAQPVQAPSASPTVTAPAAAATPPAATVAAAPQEPSENFGLRERREPESASFTVARLTTNARGDKLRVVMENGQVWTQIDYNSIRTPRDEQIVAEVTPGALDSYFMSLNGGPRFRVRRDR